MNKKGQRAKLVAELRKMHELAQKENRSFTDEENKAFAEKEAEVRKLDKEIAEEERKAKLEGFSQELPETGEAENRCADPFMAVTRGARGEVRVNMSVGGGGAAIAPEQFINELIKEVEKEAVLYKRVKKVPVTGAGSLGVPYEKADASDAAWTNEIPSSDIGSDSAWEFGKRELSPTDLVKQVLITKKLIASSALPIEELTRQKIGEKLVAAFETGIVSGTGSNQPLGVFTASNDGIPTSRDVTARAATYLTADDLINVKMKLRPEYRAKACWVMSTEVLKAVMKLKDSEGRYLWQESIRTGEPATLLGLPVLESEYAPSTIAAENYVAVLGDFSHYWFAYWKGIEIQVLNEKFAGTNQIGFLGHTLADGQPTLPAAFARLVMAAADPE